MYISIKVLAAMFMILNIPKYPSSAIVSFTRINFISYLKFLEKLKLLLFMPFALSF